MFIHLTLAVREHPVKFVTTRLHHLLDSGLHSLLPGLTGKHPRYDFGGAEQTGGISVPGHVFKSHIDIQVRHLREHLLVQGRFTVTHAHQANQQRTRLADHALIGTEFPLRVRNQLSAPERQQRRSHPLPDTVFHTVTLRPVVQQSRAEPCRVHMLRTCQHQIELELVIGTFCHLFSQRTTRRQRVKGTDLLLQMVCRRIP